MSSIPDAPALGCGAKDCQPGGGDQCLVLAMGHAGFALEADEGP